MIRTMASSSASPSSKPVDDDGFDLEELVSEILALRNLYGLLQKNTDQTCTNHLMDEKSRDLLKKLLDGATLRALRSQATVHKGAFFCFPDLQLTIIFFCPQIISATPEAPKSLPVPDTANPSHVGLLNNAEQAVEECRQCNPATPPALDAAEATEKIFSRAEEPGVAQNPLPVCKDDDSTRRDPISRPSVSQTRRKSSEPSKNPIRRAKDEKSGSVRALADRRSSGAPSSSEKGGEHQALVPAQKRARVDLPSRTRKPGRLDRELTHQKGASTAAMPKSSESNRIKMLQRTRSSRSIMLAGDQTVRVEHQRDQSAECKCSKHFERAVSKPDQKLLKQSEPASCPQRNRLPPNRLKARRYYYSSSSKSETTRSNSASSRSTTSRSPAESGPVTPTKHSRVKRSKRAAAPQCTTSRGAIHKREKAPQRMPSHPSPSAALVPNRRPPSRQRRPVKAPKTEAEKEGEGRWRRFMKNKLAIIFHHHHHHHLHAGENEDGGSRNRKEHESSLWKYLKTLLHIRSESREEQGMLAAREQHGYWHAMLEGLVRHIWGIRRRRAEKRRLGKAANRRGSKKLRWWHWFQRRGGVALGNRRRLRLGFNRSSRRRTAAGKR